MISSFGNPQAGFSGATLAPSNSGQSVTSLILAHRPMYQLARLVGDFDQRAEDVETHRLDPVEDWWQVSD
ncbi:hypothetical protein PH5382_03795 [Phaeobacter sp. CECT 5382]|nr:hypothetical protein A3720_23120 [Sulfitobacter sp. HI0021]KZX99888.1 hypothetical protein A3722_21900 [Sulfitobacter sp. HI0027]CUH89842.1 hypothetical protein PH5382_03795 [Phaeobacter sp. CECT 5382]